MWRVTCTNHLGEQTLQTFYNLGDMLEYITPDFNAKNVDYENMINLDIVFIRV